MFGSTIFLHISKSRASLSKMKNVMQVPMEFALSLSVDGCISNASGNSLKGHP